MGARSVAIGLAVASLTSSIASCTEDRSPELISASVPMESYGEFQLLAYRLTASEDATEASFQVASIDDGQPVNTVRRTTTERLERDRYVLLLTTEFGWIDQYRELAEDLNNLGLDVISATDTSKIGLAGLLAGNSVSESSLDSRPGAVQRLIEHLHSTQAGDLEAVFAFGATGDDLALYASTGNLPSPQRPRLIAMDSFSRPQDAVLVYTYSTPFSLTATKPDAAALAAEMSNAAIYLPDSAVGIIELSSLCDLIPPLSQIQSRVELLLGPAITDAIIDRCDPSGLVASRSFVATMAALIAGPCEVIRRTHGSQIAANLEECR